MSRRDERSAELMSHVKTMSADEQHAFCYMLGCIAEANQCGEVLTPVGLAQLMLDAARDTRNERFIRASEERLAEVKRT